MRFSRILTAACLLALIAPATASAQNYLYGNDNRRSPSYQPSYGATPRYNPQPFSPSYNSRNYDSGTTMTVRPQRERSYDPLLMRRQDTRRQRTYDPLLMR